MQQQNYRRNLILCVIGVIIIIVTIILWGRERIDQVKPKVKYDFLEALHEVEAVNKPSPNINVAIIIPAGGEFTQEDLKQAAYLLNLQGLNVLELPKLPASPPSSFYALPHEQRREHIRQALLDPHIDVIWAMRGGNNSADLLPFLPAKSEITKEKLLVGFSDVSSLHLYVNQVYGWPSLHAYVLDQIIKDKYNNEDLASVVRYIKGKQKTFNYELESLNPQAEKADIQGKLVGGNLTVLTTSLGTPWEIDLQGKILLLEDDSEKGERLLRSFKHLHHAGRLEGCLGIVLGDFTTDEETEEEEIKEALEEIIKMTKLPIWHLKGVGHAIENHPLLLGKIAKIENNSLTCNPVKSN